jgi:hypothetical protein
MRKNTFLKKQDNSLCAIVKYKQLLRNNDLQAMHRSKLLQVGVRLQPVLQRAHRLGPGPGSGRV